MSYDNGPGQMYRHQNYPPPPPTPLPPHPQPPPTPYDQSPMYPPPMGPDGPYPITTYTAASKRKSQRASQVRPQKNTMVGDMNGPLTRNSRHVRAVGSSRQNATRISPAKIVLTRT